MFRNIHRHPTFFPIILLFLTGGLVYFMFFSFTSKPITLSPGMTVVDENAYRQSVKDIIISLFKSFGSAAGDMARLVLVENAANALLGVTVPASYKEMHFDLIVSLNQMREGLRGSKGQMEKGNAELARILSENPWLK